MYIICVQINNGIVSVDVLNAYVLNFYGTSDYKRRLISKKVEQVVDICTKKGTVNDIVIRDRRLLLDQMIYDQQNYNTIYNINYHGDIID